MAVLPRRRSGRGRGAGSPAARGRSAQDAGTAQTVTTSKKRGRSRGRHQKPASNPTTCINGAAKRKAKARKAKAGGARGPSQVAKNRNRHSKEQALSVGAAHSHSNSPATVKSKAKDSGRNSIENVSARRGSASSSISHPKASTPTPATPRPQPLSPISSMKAKPRNSKQQRKLPPPSGSLKPPTHTSRTNLPTIAASQSRKNSKGSRLPCHMPGRMPNPLSPPRLCTRSTPPPSVTSSPGGTQIPEAASYPMFAAVSTRRTPYLKSQRSRAAVTTLPLNPQASTSFPPSRPPRRPPIIRGWDHTADPLNDWRFRTNDFVPVQNFSEYEEAAFRRRLAECHAFNMTQLHISLKEPSINKRKRKAPGCETTKGTASKGKGKWKGKGKK